MIDPLRLVRHGRRVVLAALAAFCALLAPIDPPAASAAQPEDGAAYVLLSPGSRSSTMSGSMDDLRRARALRAGLEGLLYVRRGGSAFVIRDSATLRRAEAIFEPQQALGARQAELGARQAALGHRQARLGAEQGRLGRQQADASPRRAVELGRRQAALGRQQDALGRQQGELGRQQGALGREQHRLSRVADESMRALLAEAIERGLAQRVD